MGGKHQTKAPVWLPEVPLLSLQKGTVILVEDTGLSLALCTVIISSLESHREQP